jgi:hypothetical protein
MSAPGTLDHQKILPELIGKALHLEIFRHEQYCIYIQPRITTIFHGFLGEKTGLNVSDARSTCLKIRATCVG